MKAVFLVLLAAHFCLPAAAQTYQITTFAGGSPPPTPSPALATPIGEAAGMVTDAQGNLYFTARQCVFRMDSNGVITLVAGGPGTFADPTAIARDAAGNLYVADTAASVIRKVSPAGLVSVFAGTPGQRGFCCDGGPAVNAWLNLPEGVAVDAAGNVYIADTFSQRIRKVTPDGNIATIAGIGPPDGGFSGDGGPAAQAQFSYPENLAFDLQGNLFIVDVYNQRIREISSSGIITTVAGNGVLGYGGDGGPAVNAEIGGLEGISVDSSGNIYFSNQYIGAGAAIRRIAPDGTISTIAGGVLPGYAGDGGPASSALLSPGALVTDGQGGLYIADSQSARIRRITADGIINVIAGNGLGFSFAGDGGPATSAILTAQDVAVDGAGNVFIADLHNLRVRKVVNGIISTIAGTGYQGRVGDGGPGAEAELFFPDQVVTDSAGNAYIADGFSVRKVSPDGTIGTFAGTGVQGHAGDQGPALTAQFSHISGLAIDDANNLYVSDTDVSVDPHYGAIVKVTPGGLFTKIATFGGGPIAVDHLGNILYGDGGTVSLLAPDGSISPFAGEPNRYSSSGDGRLAIHAGIREVTALAVDALGNVFIADGDYDVNNIRRVSPDGIISTIAGIPRGAAAGYSGDGGPATLALLNTPSGLAVDSNGNIYIADTGNNVVRLLVPMQSQSAR